MKKILTLTKEDKNYKLVMEDDKNRKIEIINKVINGIELYDAFYENIQEEIEYEIKSELKDTADKIIYNQLSDLFSKIDAEINQNCFSGKGE